MALELIPYLMDPPENKSVSTKWWMTTNAQASTLTAMRPLIALAPPAGCNPSAESELLFTRAALDRRPEALLLVGPNGDVTYASRAAIGLLSEKDGLELRTSGGHQRLAFADKEQQLNFDSLLGTLGGLREGAREAVGLRVVRPSTKPDYVVRLVPLGHVDIQERRLAILIVDPCERHRLDTDLLEATYALTTAELRLAEGLLSKNSLGEIAKALGVKGSTARSQLLSLFRKTRTSRQAQLVKLLMTLRLPS